METSIIISGFGGQGTLFAGQVLTYAGMAAGKEVTWIPSYGPELRGGTANCTVVISDNLIGSPLVLNPYIVIAMNMPSLEKYESLVKEGGYLIANSSLINKEFTRSGINSYSIPANGLAEELGNSRVASMLITGAMIEFTGILTLDQVKAALENNIAARHKKTIPLNFKAIDKGAEFARELMAEKV
jgi:2-oxoglutarate ferredoxin oxidoreductase subunit gamma